MQKHGWLRLWRGAPVMMVGCIPSHAAYFSVYERSKVLLGVNLPGHSPLAAAACGAMATTLHDAVLTPLDVVKQRLQLGFYSGISDCVRTVVREEGARALFRSYPTTLLMNWPYASVLVGTNETIKEALRQAKAKAGRAEDLRPAEYLASGALSGAVAAALTTPLDVLKTRLQTQGLSVAAPLPPVAGSAASSTGRGQAEGGAARGAAGGAGPGKKDGGGRAGRQRGGAGPRQGPGGASARAPRARAAAAAPVAGAPPPPSSLGASWARPAPAHARTLRPVWGSGLGSAPRHALLSHRLASAASRTGSAAAAQRFAVGIGARGCSRLGLPTPWAAGPRPWKRTGASRPGASLAASFHGAFPLGLPSGDQAPNDGSSRTSATSERDVASARESRPRVALRMPSGSGGIADMHLVRGSAPQYTGLLDAARKIVRSEGPAGFFRGLAPRMLVHAPSAAISWGTYEALKGALRPLTG